MRPCKMYPWEKDSQEITLVSILPSFTQVTHQIFRHQTVLHLGINRIKITRITNLWIPLRLSRPSIW